MVDLFFTPAFTLWGSPTTWLAVAAVVIAVNAGSVALFAYQGLWLTVALCAVFIVLSFAGSSAWRRRL